MFIGYNPIAIRWKNSFHKGFVENFMGYLLKKTQVYKSQFETDTCKILRGPFILAHPLVPVSFTLKYTCRSSERVVGEY
jgi:hypothetical protein